MRQDYWVTFYYWATFFALLMGVGPGVLRFSQAQTPVLPGKASVRQLDDSADIVAIKAGSVAFVAAFDQRDANAIAAMWTKDGEYIDASGRMFLGRDAIEGCYAELFAGIPQSKLKLTVDSVRLLSDSAAIEDGHAAVEPAPLGVSEISKYTVFHVKVDGKWLMASVRDLRNDTSSESNNVADLEWLIGDWTSEEYGVRTESKCRWVSNKKFVERIYTTKQVEGTITSGVQIIGWNPQTGGMQSWNFSPDGGYAIGVWFPTEGGWLAEVNGATADGVPTSATNLLQRLDDSAYVWQSINRTLGDVDLPNTDEVVMRRKPAAK